MARKATARKKTTTRAARKPSVGFIGTGIMGAAMAGHLQKAGYPLHVYNRTKRKAAALVKAGATWHDSPGAVAAESDIVITIVGYPKDVEQVYLGKGGILDNTKKGAVLIDMTTSSPSLAADIAKAAKKKGAASLDAPVSGGDVGAKNGTLSIMVGGDQKAYRKALPLFKCMGSNIMLQGGPGAGQHTKMCNQIVIASTIMGVAEGLTYAKKAGLDLGKVLECIGGGAAGGFQLNVLGTKMSKNDFAPGFFVKHFIKDMNIAQAEAKRMKKPLPGLGLSNRQFKKFAAGGGENSGTHGIYRYYQKLK